MGNTQNRVAGTVNFTVDGVAYALEGDFEYSSALVTRETMTGQDTVHGYSEKPIAPHISGTIRDMQNMTVLGLNAMTNVTLSAELANGKLIVGAGMWTVDAQTSKTDESKIEVKWEGMQGSVTEN